MMSVGVVILAKLMKLAKREKPRTMLLKRQKKNREAKIGKGSKKEPNPIKRTNNRLNNGIIQ